MKKKDLSSELKNAYLSDEEIEKTKENNKMFNGKNGEKLTQLYLKVMFYY